MAALAPAPRAPPVMLDRSTAGIQGFAHLEDFIIDFFLIFFFLLPISLSPSVLGDAWSGWPCSVLEQRHLAVIGLLPKRGGF